jgi:predicted nucleotidyltransferase
MIPPVSEGDGHVRKSGWGALTEVQGKAAEGFLAERAGERRHLVAYLSGAHAYGFPSPDSDLDLKCVHVAPTRQLVGLAASAGGAEIMTVIDGVEIDYGSNEVGAVLRGALKGNGNFLERLLGQLTLVEDPALSGLRPLLRAVLSRRVVHHYGGFSRSQHKAVAATPSAKKVLYVLRTALTGVHLLATGELVTDLGRLAADHPVPGVEDLIAIKLQGERVVLDADPLARWSGEMQRVMTLLDASVASSILPPDPPPAAVAALDDWLVELRRASF